MYDEKPTILTVFIESIILSGRSDIGRVAAEALVHITYIEKLRQLFPRLVSRRTIDGTMDINYNNNKQSLWIENKL